MFLMKLFVRDGCPRCPAARSAADVLKTEGFEVLEYDLATPDGLAQGAFHGVLSTPTFIVVDGYENPVRSWRGCVPAVDTARAALLPAGRERLAS